MMPQDRWAHDDFYWSIYKRAGRDGVLNPWLQRCLDEAKRQGRPELRGLSIYCGVPYHCCMGADWMFGRAEETLNSAEMLRRQNRDWPNVYYLSGLAVEHAMWAIRLKAQALLEPDYWDVAGIHDLTQVAEHAGIYGRIRATCNANREFHKNWKAVSDWQSSARYEQVSSQDAKDLFMAVKHNPHGVLKWMRDHYQTI